MMDIEISDHMTVIKILRHNLQQIRSGAVTDQIRQALDQGLLTDQHLKNKIVFSSLHEGHGPREMQAVLDDVEQHSWYRADRVVFLHNSLAIPPSTIRHVPWTWYMVNHSNWLSNLQRQNIHWSDMVKDRWFLCLMRRPSEHRSLLLKKISERFDPDLYRLSYASMIDYQKYDPIAGVNIPIILDGTTPGDEQHNAADPRIFGCVFNLVVETSCQEPGDRHWISPYLSEKTFKCFGWHQIPVWFAVPGHVAGVRQLGFDLFDDFVDHSSYDGIGDPLPRMDAVLSALQQALDLCQKHTAQEIYDKLFPRIQKNYLLLQQFDRKRLTHWTYIRQKCHEL